MSRCLSSFASRPVTATANGRGCCPQIRGCQMQCVQFGNVCICMRVYLHTHTRRSANLSYVHTHMHFAIMPSGCLGQHVQNGQDFGRQLVCQSKDLDMEKDPYVFQGCCVCPNFQKRWTAEHHCACLCYFQDHPPYTIRIVLGVHSSVVSP